MSRDFWMPDRSCRLCYECEAPFTIFNRRHHCRLCGRVFCGKCSFNTLPASVDGLQGVQSEEGDRVRVCNFCYNNSEQAKQASTPTGQTPTLTPSSSGRSLASSAIGAGAPVVSTIAPEQTLSGGSSNRQLFPDVAHDASPGKKDKMRNYQNGSRAHGSILPRARDQPPSPGSNRSDDFDEKENYEGDPSHTRPSLQEEDTEVYSVAELDHEIESKPRGTERKSSSSNLSSQSSMGHRSTVSEDGVEGGLKRTESSIYGKGDDDADDGWRGLAAAMRPDAPATADVDYVSIDAAWYPPPPNLPDQHQPDIDLDDDDGEDDDDDEDHEEGRWSNTNPGTPRLADFRRDKTAFDEHRKAMRAQVDGHFRALVSQFLYQEFIDVGEPGTPDSWLEIVSSLSWQAASYVKPDKGGGMDPGGYVKVKCIASGKPSDSVVVKGVVFRKNVANRRMSIKLFNPRVLLLAGALEYQRVSNQLSSLDTLLQQEKDHLDMTVQRIEAHHPNVLLVEKTVSRYAQEILLNKKIALALNVKKSVLERIGRCIGAQVATPPDNLLKVKLGYCEHFHVEKYTEEHGNAGQQGKQKHLMFFENCPKPQGCTILLKGASEEELKKVKTVVNLTVFAAYHLALETSFLADEGATVPDLPARSPMSISRSNSKLNVEKSGAAVPGFVMPPPVRTHPPETQFHSRSSQGMNLSVSPLPVRTSSIGPPVLYNAFDNGNPTTPVPVSFSASSSCVSSATNSPGTSPSQTTYGFQSAMARGGTSAGSSISNYHFANGVYPGGQTWRGVSGLSISLERGSADGMDNGFPGSEAKRSDVKNPGGNVDLPESDHATSRTKGEKGTMNEAGGNLYHGAGVPDDGFRNLSADVQDNWQSEMLSAEDFPTSDQQNKAILVQLSTSLKKRSVCSPPHFERIQFYGYGDKPLGSFLRDYLFDSAQKCQHCDEPRNNHVYCYTHHQGSLTISAKKAGDNIVLPGERDGKIWMWHRCLKCPLDDNVPPATPRVVMSDAAWGLSFGKFLELSFSNHEAASRVAACGHSLHRHFLRFYGFGSMVACFQYAEIKLNSVYLPPLQLEFNGPQQELWLKREVDEVRDKADAEYYEIMNKLREIGEKVASSSLSSKNVGGLQEARKFVALYQEMLVKERTGFKEMLERACPSTRTSGQRYADILQLNFLRRQLLLNHSVWEGRFAGLQAHMNSKKRYTGSIDDAGIPLTFGKNVEAQGAERDSSVSDPIPITPIKTNDAGAIPRSNTGSNILEAASPEDAYNDKDDRDPVKPEVLADANGLDFRLDKEHSTLTKAQPGNSDANVLGDQDRTLLVGDSTAVMRDSPVSVSVSNEGSLLNADGSEYNFATVKSMRMPGIDLAERRALSEGSYPLLADLSSSLSPWAGEVIADEKQKLELSKDQVDDGEQTTEVGSAEDSYRESDVRYSASSGVNTQEPGSPKNLDLLTHLPGSTTPEKVATIDAHPSVPTSPVRALTKPEESADETTIKTFSRTSSNISTTSDVSRIPSQGALLLDGDPRVLLPVGHDDVVVAVYDEEATSLIAYAISTKEHYAHVTDNVVEREKAKEMAERDLLERQGSEQMAHPLQPTGGAADTDSFKANASFFEQAVAKLEEIENPLTSTKSSQMAKKTINFGEDTPQGKVKFSVVCYFAKQFDYLRKRCCNGNTEYVRSLSRCKKWGAQGGKSNVFFAKTADDRFVVKQVTRTELNSFLDFAPAYFKYMREALDTGNPTCLAKILGVYEVKVTRGSRETKMDVIVMENLLFGRKISRLYDLKGSKRSRYNTDKSGTNQVLLDSNLLEAMPTSPIFVGSKAKRLLERAVWNDTHFLSLVFVMDYSLLVGVDEERKELVVGIIDFMRQYTWDKHLETWVKASGILGGPKDAAPTVISPKQYKKRFRKAMSTYFLMVPDVWVPAQSTMLPLGDGDEKGGTARDDDGGEDSVTPRA
ncbi:hypothetical protein AXG93_4324s1170 [Marchantia polymorpha subsp. ruderalis]|uniref:1-phosphatidylinositol-3-phosphate 5-kinase n=2 Tax=Marchantia polymorpha TaxID=3197 RepID=A0A176VZV8_MARPO|nr:hypothetical protein AXG93_4324s1170 [Marchantia polymorpha subsp. ruderalis]